MELIYGGEESYFSSLRSREAESAILNLEQGHSGKRWGRLIVHVTDVDAFWAHLKEKGFDPAKPRRTLRGVNAFFICRIRMGTSCRLRDRSDKRYNWLG